MNPNSSSDVPNDEIDEILYDLANFYTKRGKEGYMLDGSDYEGHTEAKEALNNYIKQREIEARIDELKSLPLGNSSIDFNITHELDNIDITTLKRRINKLQQAEQNVHPKN